MPHMIYQMSLYGLHREGMNTGGGSSRVAFQIIPSSMKDEQRALAMLLQDGANSILIEPALFALDAVERVTQHCDLPVGCFSVSGEYYMLKHGTPYSCQAAIKDFCCAAKRAGADFMVTYFALELAEGQLG